MYTPALVSTAPIVPFGIDLNGSARSSDLLTPARIPFGMNSKYLRVSQKCYQEGSVIL